MPSCINKIHVVYMKDQLRNLSGNLKALLSKPRHSKDRNPGRSCCSIIIRRVNQISDIYNSNRRLEYDASLRRRKMEMRLTMIRCRWALTNQRQLWYSRTRSVLTRWVLQWDMVLQRRILFLKPSDVSRNEAMLALAKLIVSSKAHCFPSYIQERKI